MLSSTEFRAGRASVPGYARFFRNIRHDYISPSSLFFFLHRLLTKLMIPLSISEIMCYVKYATIVSQFYHIIFVNSIIVKSSNPSLPPPPPVYVFKFLLISNIHETARFNLAGGGYNGNRYTRNRLVVPLINERQEDLSRRIFECTRITILVRSLRKSWQKLGP